MSRFIIQGAPYQTVLRDDNNPGIPNHAAYILPIVETDVWLENRDGYHATAIGFTHVTIDTLPPKLEIGDWKQATPYTKASGVWK